jgi:hypothetical protein
MGKAVEIISGFATNPGASFALATMSAGDSSTIRNASLQAGVFLENMWMQEATAGELRIRSPKLHDAVQGIRVKTPAADPRPRLGLYPSQKLFPQDQLTLELTGGGAEVDVFSLLIRYEDLPGQQARLFAWEELAPRIANITTQEIVFNTAATAGQYGVATAINATVDSLKANTDYAVMGYLCDTSVCSIGIRGPDTGNLRIGGPGINQAIETREWFINLSKWEGRPWIPVINSANKAGTFVDALATQITTAITLELWLAELMP